MKMNEFKSKKHLENLLNSASLPDLQQEEITNASKRVWNSLVSQGVKSSSNQSKTKMEENNLSPYGSASKQSFWGKYGLMTAGAFVMAIAIAGATVLVINANSSNKDDSSGQKTADTDNSNKTTKLSNEELKTRAAARFEELTGVTYDEVQAANTKELALTEARADTPLGARSAAISSRDYSATISSRVALTPGDVQPSEIYYSRSEITYLVDISGNIYTPIYVDKSLFDQSRPLIQEIWMSNPYNMMKISQDGKVLQIYMYTPDYSLDYRGGSYAIKTEFAVPQPLYVDSYKYFENPDLAFVEYILEGENEFIKNTGTTTINGKEYTIFEENYPSYKVEPVLYDDVEARGYPIPTPMLTNNRYYVDLETFSIYQTEHLLDNVVQSKVVKLESQSYPSSEWAVLAGSVYPTNIEVKSLTQDFNYSYDKNIQELIKTRTIYFIPDYKNVEYAYDNEKAEEYNKMYMELYQSPEFDPAYVSEIVMPYGADIPGYIAPVASYSQGNLYYEVYNSEFDLAEAYQLGKVGEEVKSLIVDGANISAKKISLQYVPEYREAGVYPTPQIYLTFVGPDGMFYVVQEYAYLDSSIQSIFDAAEIRFDKLTPEQAIQMDAENKEKSESYPIMKNVQLNELDASGRYFAGDLTTYNLSAIYLTVSSRESNNQVCLKYYTGEYYYTTLECLIEAFGGFKMSYFTDYNDVPVPLEGEGSTSGSAGGAVSEIFMTEPAFNYYLSLDYFVVMASYEDVMGYLNVGNISDNSYIVAKQFGNYTAIIISPKDQSSLTEANLQAILDNVAIDKDYAIIEAQLNQYSDTIGGYPIIVAH